MGKEILRAKAGLARKLVDEILSRDSEVELKPTAARQKHKFCQRAKKMNCWAKIDPTEAIRPKVQAKRKCGEGAYHFLQCTKCKHWSSAN